MKAEVCKKFPVGSSAHFPTLFEIALTCTRYGTLESSCHGVAANFEHSPLIVAYTITYGGNFGGMLCCIATALQTLKDRDGSGG